MTREEDAAGGVDGVKDGKWGFHTENEKDPWWQVDLGQPRKLDRVVLYNRCDGFAERNSRILVLLSDDGKHFRQVYQHDGTVFYGSTDRKPLAVKLDGAKARFVRLALEGTSYFHLDEVEVYAAGGEQNVALGKPATQSSVSQWSAQHAGPAAAAPREYPIALVVERGLKLAASQRRLGASVDEHVATPPRRSRGELAAPAGGCAGRGAPRALLPRPLGRPRDGAGESAAGLRHAPVRQARARHVPAHDRPDLRLVVAARRRRLRARGLQVRRARACAA